jgi:FMN reductase
MSKLHVVAVGGSTRPDSSTEVVLRAVLDAAEASDGVTTSALCGPALALPPYQPGAPLTPAARDLVEELRRADALVIGSPGYHGSLSGFVKNALDYAEELRADERVYLDGIPVGCVVIAQGQQAAVTTLGALRDVVHALRGWPTPLGIAVDAARVRIVRDGAVVDEPTLASIGVMARHIVEFARLKSVRLDPVSSP